LIPSLTEKLRRPVERLSLPEDVLGAQGLPEGGRGSLSFAAVIGLAWDAEPAKIDLTPPEVRLKEAFAQKGRAVVVTGVLAVSILTALTALISQHLYFKKQYLEQLNQEILRTQDAAGEVETLRKKIKIIRDVARPQNSSLEILYVLHKSTPSDVYLKTVTFDEGSQVVLKGVSQKMSTVFEFVSILEKLPNFRGVKTKNVARSGTREGGEETEFEITCPLRKNSES
jgi:Tfp pilus assembly protein PilN